MASLVTGLAHHFRELGTRTGSELIKVGFRERRRVSSQ